MGYVLLRHPGSGGRYDVHIAFRGSRSGSAGRAAVQANWTRSAKGNPDWITDLGYTYLAPEEGGSHISATGKVARGFARSMDSILPQAMRCLEWVADHKSGRNPGRIYVTGHSLGGALAQHFVSAVLLGDHLGPGGSGAAMPSALRGWPWEDIKLITYGAPRAGNEEWARALSEGLLESEIFSTPVDPYDRKALPVAHPSIVPRLADPERPAGYRVVQTKDPITTSKMIGGKHVGKSVYLDEPGFVGMLTPWSFEAHEPTAARELMRTSLSDPRIPPVAWRYREMAALNPDRDERRRGSAGEYRKLKAAIERYYRANGIWFDHAAFTRDFDLFISLLEDE
ncbi:MAG: lipase family protein [Akkermansiaceae bacterium]|nr:lipase family protein [Akkermansiaceae bacterium]